MRILQLVTRNEHRGAEMFACNLSNELGERGHDVVFAALYGPRPDQTATLPLEGVQVVELNGKRQGKIEWRPMKNLSRLIRQFKPDLVQANGFHALKYAAMLKRGQSAKWKLVYRNISVAGQWVSSGLKRRWGCWVARKADAVASVSHESAQDFHKTYKVPNDKIAVIRRGVLIPQADETVARGVLSEIVNVLPDTKFLMHVGGLTPEKNHDMLLRVMAAVLVHDASVHLLIVGSGPEACHIQSSINSLGLAENVTMVGHRSDASVLMAGATALLLTSDIEGLPGVVMEAGAVTTPVVTTDVGGCRELVSDGETGLLCAPNDDAMMASQVLQLLSDRAMRKRLAIALHERVRRQFSIDHACDNFLSLYTRLCGHVAAASEPDQAGVAYVDVAN